jgi:uncharacterized repeat protein (TIGR01451 family)
MHTQKIWRGVGLIVVMAMLFALIPGVTSAQKSAPSPLPLGTQAGSEVPAMPPEPLRASQKAAITSAMDSYLSKLAPSLRELALQAPSSRVPEALRGQVTGGTPQPVRIEVFTRSLDQDQAANGGTISQVDQLWSYFVEGTVRERPALTKTPFSGRIFFGEVLPQNLLKMASLDLVTAIIPIVLEKDGQPDLYPADEPAPAYQPGPEDWAKLREKAESLRAGSLPWSEAKAFGDGREEVTPQDWFEVSLEGPHKAEVAWARGYTGEGVTIAVLDDGVDFGHSDLIGTQKIYSSTVNTAYNGWPMVFSPFSMYLYNSNPLYALLGQPGMYYADTSEVATLSPCGSGISCFGYTPIIAWNTPGPAHTYVIADSMTKSGMVHIGTHPDFNFRDYVWGERIAVIVTDPHVAGVYDTVLVDLDDDYDFRDEKPLTRADTTSAATLEATKNNMVAYRDMSVPPDGIADISGGMLYFIANGTTPIPVSDWMWGAMIPGNGNLVAFTNGSMDSGYSHGTQCASAAVAQGVVDGLVPSFRDLAPGPGTPPAAVFGAAPDAKLVDVSNIYWNHMSSTIDAYLFAAVGYDGIDQTGYDVYTGTSGHVDTDGIQANSNSYGNSATDNDGWDYRGQLVSQLQRWWAPYEQYLFSTGNGAPGYGTTSPPSPDTGIAIGASTQYGSTGWDTITDTNQIMFNDVAVWSNRGPGARDGAGVDVLADGARGAGDEALNHYSISMWGVLDGNLSWDTWGGTSRSAPAALGNLALLYQAYKEEHGGWPTYDVAKALFMSSATDINYDVLTQGAGSVNSDRSTAVAGGLYGIWVTEPSWSPGDYRGNDWPGFAHVVESGMDYDKTFTVQNDGATGIMVTIDDGTPTLIDSETFTYTITPAMFEAKDVDNFFRAPQWIIPLTATSGVDDWWYNIPIPDGTDLMIVRARYSYDQFDANGDYNWDNRFRMAVYNWKDVNGNGIVWDDKNGNGVVNFVNTPIRNQIDMTSTDGDIDWTNPATEVDHWEYGRFDYNRPGGNVLEQWVQDPKGRMLDGLFIGLQQYEASTVQETDLTFQIDFYSYEDVPWLDTDVSSLNVPAGDSATFEGSVDVPADMPPGDYEAAIKIYDPGTVEYAGHTTVIPVVIHVAAQFAPDLTLGGQQSLNYDAGLPYNNGLVRGEEDWTWRAESGDWRFFYMDLDASMYDPGTTVLIKDEWNDAAPHTDIDTIVLGPTASPMGSGYYDFPEPGYFGPYVLDTIASSPNTNFCTNAGCGEWRFNTSSGSNQDWVSFPLEDGLYEVLQHNVLFEGDKFEVPFTKTLGLLWEDKHEFDLSTYVDQGEVGTVVITPSLDLNGLVATGYGMGELLDLTGQPLPSEGWTYQFSVQDGYRIYIETQSFDISDIDLFLYHWNGSAWQGWASSTTSSAYEAVDVVNPPDGDWLIFVDNFSGTAGHFDLHMEVIQGTGISVTGTTAQPIPANTGHTLTISYDYPMEAGKSYYGLVVLGPPEAPSVKEIPIYIHRLADSAYIEKEVNYELTFPGSELKYTIDLYNLSDPMAVFGFADPIPDNTTFVTVEMSCFPMSLFAENFEGSWPPAGWSVVVNGDAGGFWNTNTYWGNVNVTGGTGQSADADSDAWGYGAGHMDTELWSPPIDLTAAPAPIELSFMSNFQDNAGSGDAWLDVSTDGGGTWTNLYYQTTDDPSMTTGVRRDIDLSAYAGQTIRLRWHYDDEGDWAWWWQIDDVMVTAMDCPVITYDPVADEVVYNGELPLGTAFTPPQVEGFEELAWPPMGWEIDNVSTGGVGGWYHITNAVLAGSVHSGTYAAWANYTEPDIRLYSPWLDVTAGDSDLTFWGYANTDSPNAEMSLYAHDEDGNATKVWSMFDETWGGAFAYRQATVDLSVFVGQRIRLEWRYESSAGTGAGSFGLDDIVLPGDVVTILDPSATVWLTVLVDDGVAGGTAITNTGTLEAAHDMPGGKQVETALASAVSHIGLDPTFTTSYKMASETAPTGGEIDYEVHVINSGDELVEVTFTDPIPANTTYAWHDVDPPYQHLTYDDVLNQMSWTGNVAPGEEWVFSFAVDVDPGVMFGTVITNTATISASTGLLDVSDSTLIVAPYIYYLPIIFHN